MIVRLTIAALVLTAAPEGFAGTRDAQGAARRELHAGAVLKLRDIERKVVPEMQRLQYIGPEYDQKARAYRLKFIRNGRVVFVDVDARSGQVIGRSE